MTTTIAFLGPAGTFTEAAVHKFAAHLPQAETMPVGSPSEAVAAVRAGQAEYACVAIENSVDGAVTTTFDALVEAEPVQIYREVDIPVAFSIMTRPGKGDIRRLSTHPVAFQQIRGWVKNNLPEVEFVPASSNAAAAEAVARGDADAAAAPARAAEIFGLETIAQGVADVEGCLLYTSPSPRDQSRDLRLGDYRPRRGGRRGRCNALRFGGKARKAHRAYRPGPHERHFYPA